MRFRLSFYGKLLSLIFLSIAFFAHPTAAQNDTLSIKDITTGLKASGDFTQEEKIQFIMEQVKVRGVDFLLTPSNETILTEAGATSNLLEVIREESLRTNSSASDLVKADEFFNTGLTYLNSQLFDRAIESFQQAIGLNSRHGSAYGGLGLAYYGKKDYEQSISFYNKAIAAKPDPKMYFNRASAYYNIKSYDKAVRDYSQTIEMQPGDAKAYLNRGLAHFANNETEKAIADYEKVLELEPNNTAVLKKLETARKWKEIQDKKKETESPE